MISKKPDCFVLSGRKVFTRVNRGTVRLACKREDARLKKNYGSFLGTIKPPIFLSLL